MREIHLHGNLGDVYGPVHKYNVRSVAEAVRACCYTMPGFKQTLLNGQYQVVRGKQLLDPEADTLTNQMHLNLGRTNEIHFIPVPQGAGGDGFGKIIIGTLLVATAFIAAPSVAVGGLLGPSGSALGLGQTAFLGITYGQIAAFGGLVALAGISQLVSPTPKVRNYGDREKADQRGSFLINSRVNTIEEGLTIPIVYGRTRVGSAVISAGLSAETELTSQQIITTSGWVSNSKFYRWKSVGSGSATSAYSVHWDNNTGAAALPSDAEEVIFYGFHRRPSFNSQGQFLGTIPFLYLSSASLSYFFSSNLPSVPLTGMGSIPFPYEDQGKPDPRLVVPILNNQPDWYKDRPLTLSSYPGLFNPAHASPWNYLPMHAPAGGSQKAGSNTVLSAIEYTDASADKWFQLTIAPTVQLGTTISGGTTEVSRIPPTFDHFDTVTVQADDTDRTTIYELARTDAETNEEIWGGARVWRWAIGTTGIKNISAPASATSDKSFWVRYEKEPTTIITTTMKVGSYNQLTWDSSAAGPYSGTVFTAQEMFGDLALVGDTGTTQDGPTGSPLNRKHYANELPSRDSDRTVFLGSLRLGTIWAYVLGVGSRPVDWVDSIEFRSTTDNSLIKLLNTSESTFHDDEFVLSDGTDATLWAWEADVDGVSLGSHLDSNVKVIVKYRDREAEIN